MQRDMGNAASLAKSGPGARPLIACENLACVRGDRLLFRGLGFALNAGQALHVTGPNGTGKSSLLRVLAGLLRPYAGTLHSSAMVALGDERPALDSHWTLTGALGFWARIDGARREHVEAALEATGLTDLAEVPLRYFSAGQRKRATLARILASGADIWLLDEPANGLDSASIDRLGHVMQAHLEQGGAIIAASHQALPLNNAAVLPLEGYSA